MHVRVQPKQQICQRAYIQRWTSHRYDSAERPKCQLELDYPYDFMNKKLNVRDTTRVRNGFSAETDVQKFRVYFRPYFYISRPYASLIYPKIMFAIYYLQAYNFYDSLSTSYDQEVDGTLGMLPSNYIGKQNMLREMQVYLVNR